MEQKPVHYDGSVQHVGDSNVDQQETFLVTDEMRKNIGQNPYSQEISE
jgi:hypothetical protein